MDQLECQFRGWKPPEVRKKWRIFLLDLWTVILIPVVFTVYSVKNNRSGGFRER